VGLRLPHAGELFGSSGDVAGAGATGGAEFGEVELQEGGAWLAVAGVGAGGGEFEAGLLQVADQRASFLHLSPHDLDAFREADDFAAVLGREDVLGGEGVALGGGSGGAGIAAGEGDGRTAFVVEETFAGFLQLLRLGFVCLIG
jgi:hypothetical protein